MPIHDWTRVKAGIFHDFHHEWISEIKRSLNRGLLPPGYYAMAEQIAGGMGPDVLTLEMPTPRPSPKPIKIEGGVALATRPPKVRFHATEAEIHSRKAKAVVVRHASNHQVIAMIELVSPGNKGSQNALASFVRKAREAIQSGIHLLIVDLFPPGPRSRGDPRGHPGGGPMAIRPTPRVPPDLRGLHRLPLPGSLPGARGPGQFAPGNAPVPDIRNLRPGAPGSDVSSRLGERARLLARSPRRRGLLLIQRFSLG